MVGLVLGGQHQTPYHFGPKPYHTPEKLEPWALTAIGFLMALSRPDDYHDYFDDFQDEGTTVTPGRLRAMINKLLESTDIKIGEFQKMIGVNANSWGKFMHGKYKDPWSATQNGTYFAAAYFFYRERKLGKHALGKTRAHKASASGAGAAAADTAMS